MIVASSSEGNVTMALCLYALLMAKLYASLPTHIDLPELNHLLSAHFSIYPQVKDVKAIRDNNKGSVCAFVQCEVCACNDAYIDHILSAESSRTLGAQDAEAASQLLKTLQESQPRPFQGRFLRFEFARASRTLVVAYRYVSLLMVNRLRVIICAYMRLAEPLPTMPTPTPGSTAPLSLTLFVSTSITSCPLR